MHFKKKTQKKSLVMEYFCISHWQETRIAQHHSCYSKFSSSPHYYSVSWKQFSTATEHLQTLRVLVFPQSHSNAHTQTL